MRYSEARLTAMSKSTPTATKKTVRVWIFYLGSPVRLSLGERDSVAIYEYTPDDEGFHARISEVSRRGDQLTCWTHDRSKDCDGLLESFDEKVCSVDDARLSEPTETTRAKHPDIDGFPMWRSERRSQRDHSAEAAGY